MSDTRSGKCPRCGAPIPNSAENQLCAACLMSGALAAGVDRTVSLADATHSPAQGEPKRFPCNFGGYRLHGLLGRGGMGTVYDAEQLSTSRRVALKILGQEIDSPEMRQRFLREGRLAAGVNHPNSLYIFGAEEIDGVPVITMEVASSGTLKDRLQRRGPFPITEAVDAILDVISGLEAAAAAGVLHRDIKPANCFIYPDGTIKIGDFGLSVSTLPKEDSYVTATGVIMGTPAYAAPEQLRGDELDLRADIYSVGATLFTLLTNRAPFEGNNAVQVVANAVNQKPTSLSELRDDVPKRLEQAVIRCLAKEPDGRYADYRTLRNALLPFSSREPEPASMLVRISAGWVDFLIAYLPIYVILMFIVGGEALLVSPVVERTLYSARYYFLLLGCGFLYFAVAEGIFGAGVGKRLKGLRVVAAGGRRPGFLRGLLRIVIPILCVEGVRMPLMIALIGDANWTGVQTTIFVVAAIVCGWIPGLLALRASPENGFATLWDRLSGTRVVLKPEDTQRPSLDGVFEPAKPTGAPRWLGPYHVTDEIIPGEWLVGTDPVLRRQVWLWRRISEAPTRARRSVARQGRLRWLQHVETDHATWDAYEARTGTPYRELTNEGERIPWSTLRHWLHDLASELWAASGDETLATELSVDHIWIVEQGNAVLLDRPWPSNAATAECIQVQNLAGQQQFLSGVAASIETTSLPLHAWPVLKNLKSGTFEKLSFLTGNLRGLLNRPADVSGAIRAASMYMLPAFVWIAMFVGRFHDKEIAQGLFWSTIAWRIVSSATWALGALALLQLVELPFRGTCSHVIFRLAIVDDRGEIASVRQLLVRWMVIWLPLFIPLLVGATLAQPDAITVFAIFALCLLLAWIAASIPAIVHPNQGWHDRLAGTWVVRR